MVYIAKRRARPCHRTRIPESGSRWFTRGACREPGLGPQRRRDCRRSHELGIPRRIPCVHGHGGCDSKGNCIPADAAARVRERPATRFVLVGRTAAARSRAQAARRTGRPLHFRGISAGRRRRSPRSTSCSLCLGGTPLTGFEALAAGSGDRGYRRRRFRLTSSRRPRRGHRAEARCRRWRQVSGPSTIPQNATGCRRRESERRRYDIGLFVRKMERLLSCCTRSRADTPRGRYAPICRSCPGALVNQAAHAGKALSPGTAVCGSRSLRWPLRDGRLPGRPNRISRGRGDLPAWGELHRLDQLSARICPCLGGISRRPEGIFLKARETVHVTALTMRRISAG